MATKESVRRILLSILRSAVEKPHGVTGLLAMMTMAGTESEIQFIDALRREDEDEFMKWLESIMLYSGFYHRDAEGEIFLDE